MYPTRKNHLNIICIRLEKSFEYNMYPTRKTFEYNMYPTRKSFKYNMYPTRKTI